MVKRSHLGMSGHYAAMSEFLYRGYNVAVPSVDIGDDVYVVEDGQGTMWRLQVKTSEGDADRQRRTGGRLTSSVCTYNLSRSQLRTAKPNELFFMFLARWEARWRFVLIAREKLSEIRETFEQAPRSGRGRPPIPGARAQRDTLTMEIKWNETSATGWGDLSPYLDRWPETFPESPDGPGAARGGAR